MMAASSSISSDQEDILQRQKTSSDQEDILQGQTLSDQEDILQRQKTSSDQEDILHRQKTSSDQEDILQGQTLSDQEDILQCKKCRQQVSPPVYTFYTCFHSYCGKCVRLIPSTTSQGIVGLKCVKCDTFTRYSCIVTGERTYVHKLLVQLGKLPEETSASEMADKSVGQKVSVSTTGEHHNSVSTLQPKTDQTTAFQSKENSLTKEASNAKSEESSSEKDALLSKSEENSLKKEALPSKTEKSSPKKEDSPSKLEESSPSKKASSTIEENSAEIVTSTAEGSRVSLSSDNLQANKPPVEQSKAQQVYCRLHKSYPIQYYCHPCMISLCQCCVSVNHKDHNHEELKFAADRVKQELSEELKLIKMRIADVLEKQIHCLETELEECDRGKEKSSIADLFQEIKQMFRDKEDECQQLLETMKQTTDGFLSDKIKELERELKRKQNIVQVSTVLKTLLSDATLMDEEKAGGFFDMLQKHSVDNDLEDEITLETFEVKTADKCIANVAKDFSKACVFSQAGRCKMAVCNDSPSVLWRDSLDSYTHFHNYIKYDIEKAECFLIGEHWCKKVTCFGGSLLIPQNFHNTICNKKISDIIFTSDCVHIDESKIPNLAVMVVRMLKNGDVILAGDSGLLLCDVKEETVSVIDVSSFCDVCVHVHHPCQFTALQCHAPWVKTFQYQSKQTTIGTVQGWFIIEEFQLSTERFVSSVLNASLLVLPDGDVVIASQKTVSILNYKRRDIKHFDLDWTPYLAMVNSHGEVFLLNHEAGCVYVFTKDRLYNLQTINLKKFELQMSCPNILDLTLDVKGRIWTLHKVKEFIVTRFDIMQSSQNKASAGSRSTLLNVI